MHTGLQKLGFDNFFESNCRKLAVRSDSVARVFAQHKGIYSVKKSREEFQAGITGKQMFTATSRDDYPVVGDWVTIKMADNDHAIIEHILPRKTVIRKTARSRKNTGKTKNQIIAANVDVAFVVESVDRDFSLNRFERYFALIEDADVEPAIILNKLDLISKTDLASKITEIQARFKDCSVIPTSTQTLEGLTYLRDSLHFGETYCFLGSSGVGKSSLINALLGHDSAKTGAIGLSTERGKHVTTHREMYFLDNGGIVIDNPGMREVGLVGSEAGVNATYDEISDLSTKCQFTNCTHVHESGCAVREAVESGKILEDRYINYIQLKKEAEHYEMTGREERNKEKKFGKFVKDYHKRMKEFE